MEAYPSRVIGAKWPAKINKVLKLVVYQEGEAGCLFINSDSNLLCHQFLYSNSNQMSTANKIVIFPFTYFQLTAQFKRKTHFKIN